MLLQSFKKLKTSSSRKKRAYKQKISLSASTKSFVDDVDEDDPSIWNRGQDDGLVDDEIIMKQRAGGSSAVMEIDEEDNVDPYSVK